MLSNTFIHTEERNPSWQKHLWFNVPSLSLCKYIQVRSEEITFSPDTHNWLSFLSTASHATMSQT